MEVIESRPAMVANCRSRGVATEAAMVSGLAPGSDAYLNRRKVDVGQIAHRKRAIARDPEQQDPHHHQRGHHRPLDE